MRKLVLASVVVASVGALVSPVHAGPFSKLHALRGEEAILGLDYAAARSELAAGDVDDPDVERERGRLALYEGDCDGALLALAHTEVLKDEEAATLADIARGCVRVTAATVVEEDKGAQVWVRFQDEADRALMPLIVDTVVTARDALTKDLGVTWPMPTRIIVVRDLLSLSAMTGLPYESAKTTGTVAVAKWGRVTLLSPRASSHGYAWRDTIAHELTHLAVTRASIDRAPLWLQEGVAKREEIRWRPPGPFDDRPSPDAIVAWGMKKKLDIALDQLGPSIAMLPSAEAAMVAFAEVTSFVRYYADHAGEGALPKLFLALRDAKPDGTRRKVDEALAFASGADLKAWDDRWRKDLLSRPAEPTPSFLAHEGIPNAREMRDKVRLAELLYGREHADEALTELGALTGAFLEDPNVRYLHARTLETLHKNDDARPLLADPKEVSASFGPWWAIRGRLARGTPDGALADPSFAEAVAEDPLETEPACESLDLSVAPPPAKASLCAAARLRGEPDLGRD